MGLPDKAQEVFDKKNAEKLQEKLKDNTFTLIDFQNQLNQMKKMGSIGDMLSMMPNSARLGNLSIDDKQLVWTDAIINSMTNFERLHPNIINGSRRQRIAKGSGRNIQEVNQLLKQFEQMKNYFLDEGYFENLKVWTDRLNKESVRFTDDNLEDLLTKTNPQAMLAEIDK